MSVDCKLILNSLLQRINDAVQETINSLETQTNEDEIQTLNKKNKENINVVKIKNNDFSKQNLRNGKKKHVNRMETHVIQTANTLNRKGKKNNCNIDVNGLSRKGFSLLSILTEPNSNNPKIICKDNTPPRKRTLQSKKGDFKKMETIKELLELLNEKKDVKISNTNKTVKNKTYTVFPVKDDYRFCSSEKMLQLINFESESDDEEDDSSGTSDTSDALDTSDTEGTSSNSAREGSEDSHEANYATNYETGCGTNYGSTIESNYEGAESYGTSYGTSYGGNYGESSEKAYTQNFTQNDVENTLQGYNDYGPQPYANNYARNAQQFIDNCTENYTGNNQKNLADNDTNYFFTENNLQSCINDYTDDDEVGNYTINDTDNNFVNNSESNKKEFVDNYTHNYAENYGKSPVCPVSMATGMENVTPPFTNNCIRTSPRGTCKLLKVDKQNSPCFVVTPSMTSEDISSLQIVCDSLPMEHGGNNNRKKRKGFFSKIFRRTSKCALKKSKAKVPDSYQTVCVKKKLSTISYGSTEPNSETSIADEYQSMRTSLKAVNPKPVFTKSSQSFQKETDRKATKLVCPECNKPLNCFEPLKLIVTKDTHTCMRQPVKNIISSGSICKKSPKVCSKKLVNISTSPIELENRPRYKRLSKKTSSSSTSCESVVTVRRKRSYKPNLKKINKATLNGASSGPKEIIYLSDDDLDDLVTPQPSIQKPRDTSSPQLKIQKQNDSVTLQPAKRKLYSTISEPIIKKYDDLATTSLEESIIADLPVQKDKETDTSQSSGGKSKYLIPQTSIKEPENDKETATSPSMSGISKYSKIPQTSIKKPKNDKETATSPSINCKSKYSMIPQTSIKAPEIDKETATSPSMSGISIYSKIPQTSIEELKSDKETATTPSISGKSKYSMTPQTSIKQPENDKETATTPSISGKSKLSMIPQTPIEEPDTNVKKITISSKPKSTSTTSLRTKKSTAQIATVASDLIIKRDAVQEKFSPTFTQSYSLPDSIKDNNLKLKSEYQSKECKDCASLKESFNSLLRSMLCIALKQNGTTQFKSNAKTISGQFSNGTGDRRYLRKQKRQKYYDKDEDSYSMGIFRRNSVNTSRNYKDLSSKIRNLDEERLKYYDKDEDSYRMNIFRRKSVSTSRNHKDLSSKIKNLDEVLQDRLLEPYLDHLLNDEPHRKVKARNYFSPCSGNCGKEIYHCVHNNPLIYSLAKHLKRDRVFNDDISDYLKYLKKTSCYFGGVHVNRYFR